MTIKEIAQICGVSRGTVDRVVNKRGRVKPETEQQILRAIESLGYTKSIVGRALSVKRTEPVIGTLLCSEGNPFFNDVIDGIAKAGRELEDYGVKVISKAMFGHDVSRQVELIKALEGEISALVIQPINDARIEEQLCRLKEKGVPTVTINTDIADSCRCCYVGSDYETGGETAAALMELVTQGHASVGVIAGVDTLMGHVLRLRGFENRLAQCPGLKIVSRTNAMDDERRAYVAAKRMLENHPEIDAMFVVAVGCDSVCRAVIDAGRENSLRVVAYDDVPTTREMLRRGIVKATVCQQPFEQGYRAVRAAFDMILSGNMMHDEKIITENQIKILENLN